MKLNVINLQKKIPIIKKKIKKQIRKILLLQNKANSNLSVVFVNDKSIKKLNKEFLHKDRSTDVLAFNLKNSNKSKKTIEGEIIISLETALNNAKLYKTSCEHEMLLYLTHGILHLCGFDDKNKKETNRMRKREQYILERII